MSAEYSNDKIVLRDTSGIQMSLPRFFQLALTNEEGTHGTQPSSGLYRNGSTEFHGGWDMGAGTYTDVYARTPAAGTVVYQGGMTGFGPNVVIIKEDDYERYHYFGHMASSSVHQGDIVNQGDIVGIIGGYGGSAGNWNPNAYPLHLHYEIMDVNIAITGGYSTDIQHVLNPMDVFDEATLPSGWIFGYDPITQPVNYAALAYNWEYIALDHSATDFGPPGGDTPSQPYFPEHPCHDISWAQVSGGSLSTCIDAIAAAGHSGVIIQVGGIYDTGFVAASSFSPGDAIQRALNQGLGLGIYFYNYGHYETDNTSVFEDALDYITGIGATPDKINLGIWLDTEYNAGQGYDPEPNPNPAVNYSYVEKFLTVFDGANYPVVGVYSSAANFEPWFGYSRIGDKPIWAAYWTGTFDTVDRSTLDAYLPEAQYTKVYLMQYSATGRIPGWANDLDCVKVLSPMPTDGGGGGGGGTTEVIDVTVDIVPPKRVYFNPVPGLLNPPSSILSEITATVELSTDAEHADLYYTTDGSTPYQYTNDGTTLVYTLAANALLYDNGITINKDTHIRVVAVPTGTLPGEVIDELLAKASGTYLFAYRSPVQDWQSERQSYATSNDDTSFFEENKQAFLRLHNLPTEEEILYATVYKHDIQKPESNAVDNASSTHETTPNEEEL